VDKIAKYKDQICKEAELNHNVQLYLHQQRVVDDPATSKILAHPTGSGKTLTAIAKFERMKDDGKAKKALVVVPSGLRENFGLHGVGKFTSSKYNIIGNKQEIAQGTGSDPNPDADYNIISYEIFKKDPEKYIKELGIDTVILDEGHRQKNEDTAVTEALKRTRKLYPNLLSLTGSVISNSIADVQPLVDVEANGIHGLGKNKQQFSEMYLQRSKDPQYKGYHEKRIPVVGFKNRNLLKQELARNVDYVDEADIKDLADMPDKDIHVEEVPISKEQARLYKHMLNENPAARKMILTKRLETLKDEESAKAFSMLIESRKLMNSVGSVRPGIDLVKSSKITPKTKKLLDDLQQHLTDDPKGQALLFTHLVNGGVDVLEAGLKDRGIDYGKFIGKGNEGVSEASRQQAVRDYNAGKKRVMLISSAGGEGLSLNDTTWEGVEDPHYNPEKMKQMEARGVRSGGLKGRPEAERVVHVNRYLATMPKTLGIIKSRYKTPDEFIYGIAQNKDKQNKLLFDLMHENAMELNKKRKAAEAAKAKKSTISP